MFSEEFTEVILVEWSVSFSPKLTGLHCSLFLDTVDGLGGGKSPNLSCGAHINWIMNYRNVQIRGDLKETYGETTCSGADRLLLAPLFDF